MLFSFPILKGDPKTAAEKKKKKQFKVLTLKFETFSESCQNHNMLSLGERPSYLVISVKEKCNVKNISGFCLNMNYELGLIAPCFLCFLLIC